ncbi:hypothetical protein KNO15_03365 [Leifsonia shinshuensis]|uniref:hypothetical protein n=1 Tax=Leifsonia shinshuensis TaxID=150026 RepID=UPI001F509B38|nr:hypothetical protein [Leifsonia shinshuensis]MCI0155735.1 hypothetical protein [Leifsonia shinshuensis]
MSSIRERIANWFKREREYEPPAGRLREDTIQRLPSGGGIQRLPGDGVDPTSLNGRVGRNP